MSALDELLKAVESDLNLVRRDLNGRLEPIRSAIDAYERAVQEEAVLSYCRDHSLKRPPVLGTSRSDAAERLLRLVASLPEMEETQQLDPPQESRPSVEPVSQPSDEVTSRFLERFPALSRASGTSRLLVLGAFAGRTKSLPGPLNGVTDWVDTATDGNRLVESAVKRMRAGSVFGVIICDQAIQHQHSEPVTDLARAKRIPLAYAGKGGNASLARAIESLEKSLR